MASEAQPEAGGLVRIGVAIDEGLLRRFDAWLAERGGGNRSEAFRDLIRDRLIATEMGEHADVVASVSIVYDHHHRVLNRRLTDLQHHHGDMVVSTLHVHLEQDRCLEVVVLRGRAAAVRAFADRLIGEKGVLHGGVFITRRLDPGLARELPEHAPGHDHGHEHRSAHPRDRGPERTPKLRASKRRAPKR
jgi:CopG family transcriptional regulator, nickel-responsive regulator